MVEIRDYKDSDYDDVKINLLEASMFNDVWDSRGNLKKKIERNPGSILVAIVDNHAVGNQYIIEDGWEAFLFRLAVRSAYRGQSIGSMLMDEAERRLKDKGIREVSLFVREGDFDRLEQYYKRRGYIAMNERHQCMYKVL